MTRITKRDAISEGYQRGYNIASWQDMPEIGTEIPRHIDYVGYRTVDKDNQIDVWEMLCGEAESSGRDFSPFEVVAHALNESRDPDGYWQAFDEAITRGIRAYRRKHYPKR